MQDVQLIATDMDHTLLTEAGELPPDFGHTLDRIENAGIQFAIASGRPIYTLRKLFPEHYQKLVLICDNGGVIMDRGEIVAKNLLPNDAIQAMCAAVLAHSDGRPMICGIDGAVASTADQQYDDVYREFYHELRYVDDLRTWQGEADKLTIYLPNRDSEQVFEDVVKPQFGDQFSTAVSGPDWIDIMPKHVNKGTAMAAIGRRRGIGADAMMAFGDTFNDAQMLSYVKYGYLVANANPGMRQYAHLHTASNDEYGVVKVIDKVLAAQ
ncbi:HAD family hydrolase [Lacticaseibacillus sp. GG6-2]